MTTPISDFLPLVSPEVLGCPQVISKSKVLEAIIELCKRAPVWKYEVAKFDTVAGTRDYTPLLPVSTTHAKYLSVNFNEYQLEPKSDDSLKEIYTDWRTESGNPLFFTSIINGELSLIPIPDAIGQVSIFMSISPTVSATDVESFIYNNYATTIAKGAKYLLMSMVGTKWYNPQMADYYQREFYSEVGDILVKTQKGNVGAPLRSTACYGVL